MNRKVNIIFFELLLAIVLLFVFVTQVHACFLGFGSNCGQTADATQQQQNQQMSVADNQAKMETAVPLPMLNNSLERENISKRLQLFSDPNKVSYIYLISYGKVMAFYTVKGKITSGQKRLTASQNQVEAQNWSGTGNGTELMEAPELDGTYGQSSPYIFFWTTDGTYVQWNGEYMMADQPLQLSTPPELVTQVK